MINLNSLTPAYSFESLEFGKGTDKWLVRLSARTDGLWARILSLFNIKRGMTFEVYGDRVVLNEGWRHVIPVQHISNLGDGYQSQGLFLLLAWISAFVGIYKVWHGDVGPFLVWGLLAALFGYLYVRSRRFVIDVKASSGHSVWFSIKRSYFGGVALPDNDLYRMVELVQKLTANVSGLPRQEGRVVQGLVQGVCGRERQAEGDDGERDGRIGERHGVWLGLGQEGHRGSCDDQVGGDGQDVASKG